MTETPSEYSYWAFISYSSKDQTWAKRLHRAIETYGVPAQLVGRETPVGEPAPKRLQPIFRDREELAASSDLGQGIENALRASRYLIVVCSPHAAQSRWVNREIEIFCNLDRKKQILPLIIDGEPGTGDSWECFPPALKQLEPVAADARRGGDRWNSAKLKLLSGMLGVNFDVLKQREAQRRIRRLEKVVVVAAVLVLAFLGLSLYANQKRLDADRASRQAVAAEATAVTEAQVRSTAQAQAQASEATAIAEAHTRATAQVQAEEARATAVVEVQVRATAQAMTEEQRQVAVMRQLAAHALNVADRRLDFGLLLSVQANERAKLMEEADRDVSLSDVRGALLNALLLQPRLKLYLPGHPKGISNIALSPSGQILAAGTVDNTIVLWDVASARPIGQPLVGHHSPVISLAFSPDGKVLASGSNDPVFRLWDVSDPEQPVLIAARQTEPPLGRVVFSSDGRTFTLTSGDGLRESAHLWNTPVSQPGGQDFISCSCGVLSLAFSPDGTTLATGGGDGHVELWNVPDQNRVKTLTYFTQQQFKPDGGIMSLAFSPDGNRLASGSGRGYIRIWDLASNSDQPSRVKFFLGVSLAQVAFSPDGSTLAYSNGNNAINLWDLASDNSNAVTVTKTPNRVLSIAYSPDGKTLAMGTTDGSVILWDIASNQPIGEPLRGHDSEVYTLAFGADGKTLASSDWNHNIILWDLTASYRLGKPLVSDGYWTPSVAFSPNGTTIVSAIGITSTEGSTILLWDIAQSPPVSRTFSTGNRLQSDVIISPDGETLAASEKDSIVLWNLASRQPITRLDGSGEWIAFSPDGRILAVGSAETITLWNVETGLPVVEPLSAGEEQISSIGFNPDSTILASGTDGGSILLWDTATGKQLGPPLTGHVGRVSSLAFSPNGQMLVSGGWDKLILLWDLAARRPVQPPLKGHTDWVTSVAFNPADGGQTLASGSMDGTARLWDARTHQQLGSSLTRLTGRINNVAYSPDGNWLATGGEGGTMIVWEAAFDSWKDQACRVANRNLSLSEWQEYFTEAYQKTCPDLPLPPSLVESFLTSEQQLLAVGEMPQALSQFQESSNLDRGLTHEMEQAARDFPVWNLAKRGADLALQGDLVGALQVYQEIQYLGATDEALVDPWNEICWFGGTAGHASDELVQVCEKAVALAPNNGAIRDSRGLVRALTGDYAGAIEDFKAFVAWSKEENLNESETSRRETWITELQAGRSPFDAATLTSLRNEIIE